MISQPFHAQLRILPDRAIIDLTGEMNADAEGALNASYSAAEKDNPSMIVLNFNDVSYINSTGIALIVGLLGQARKSHRRLAAYGLSDHYLEIFQITRLADFMTIITDESSVLDSVKN